jgi:hypothetical protein
VESNNRANEGASAASDALPHEAEGNLLPEVPLAESRIEG